MQIRDIMSTGVDSCAENTSIARAAREMRDRDIGFLCVVDSDRILGTVTDRDIVVRGVAATNPAETPVADVMSNGVVWLYEDQTVEEALRAMADNAVRRIPVVNREKRPVGLISLGDIAGRSDLDVDVGAALNKIFRRP